MPREPVEKSHRHLIRLTIGETKKNTVDLDEVRRVVEYLGGVATDEGFLFASAQRRVTALNLLVARFGPQCFTTFELPPSDEDHLGREHVRRELES